MTRSVRNSHTLSRRLHRQGGPVRLEPSRVDPAVSGPAVNGVPARPAGPPNPAGPPGCESDPDPYSQFDPTPPRMGELSANLPRAAGFPGRAGVAMILLWADVAAMVVAGVLTRTDLALHLTICLVAIAANALVGLYRSRLTMSILDDLPRLAACFLGGLAVGSLVRTELPSAAGVSLGGAVALGAGLIATRAVGYSAVRWLRVRGPGSVTVILGTGQVGCRLGQAMLHHPQHGLRLVGYLDDERRRQARPPAPLLGRAQDLGRLIGELGVSHVVVAFGTVPVATLVDVIRTCDRMRCEILLVPRLFELHAATRDTEHVQGLPLVRMRRAPFRRLSWRAKRAVDIVGSAVLMVVLAPVLLTCALAVRVEGGPGVLFRQERVGLDGRRFQMLKFRSLKPSSDVESRVRWTVARDPRMGPVGRMLRTTSLDELPQLFNVFRGDMSLVGPRPERPHFVDQLSRMNPRYHARLRVPAGMTGWAAVNGLRGDTSIFDRVHFDNSYIQSWSLWLDIKILVRTIGAVLGRTGG